MVDKELCPFSYKYICTIWFSLSTLYAFYLARHEIKNWMYEWECSNVFLGMCWLYVVYLDKSNLNANDGDVCSFFLHKGVAMMQLNHIQKHKAERYDSELG